MIDNAINSIMYAVKTPHTARPRLGNDILFVTAVRGRLVAVNMALRRRQSSQTEHQRLNGLG